MNDQEHGARILRLHLHLHLCHRDVSQDPRSWSHSSSRLLLQVKFHHCDYHCLLEKLKTFWMFCLFLGISGTLWMQLWFAVPSLLGCLRKAQSSLSWRILFKYYEKLESISGELSENKPSLQLRGSSTGQNLSTIKSLRVLRVLRFQSQRTPFRFFLLKHF